MELEQLLQAVIEIANVLHAAPLQGTDPRYIALLRRMGLPQ
jgi:hypothetical protein